MSYESCQNNVNMHSILKHIKEDEVHQQLQMGIYKKKMKTFEKIMAYSC